MNEIKLQEVLQDARPPMSIKRDWLWTDPEEDEHELSEMELEGIHLIR